MAYFAAYHDITTSEEAFMTAYHLLQAFRGAAVGLGAGLAMILSISPGHAAPAAPDAATAVDPNHDGAHDFDFLIGDWKAHVRRLPDRLVGSNKWIEYDGISNHKKLLDSNGNFEQFEVWSPDKQNHIKAQTLRLYNPASHQWSIYLVDLDKGTLGLPATVGQFTGKRGEFYDHEDWKGRMVLVRFVWLDLGPHAAHMDQSFSPDGGKTWEVNWICDLSR
jgi:hypothetical protein